MSPSLADLGWRAAYRCAYQLERAWCWAQRQYRYTACAAVWCEGRVLLVQSSCRPWLSLPGGFVRQGKRYADAAARELHAAVGIALDPRDLASAGAFYHRSEWLPEILHIYEADLRREPALTADRRRIVWAGLVDWREALHMAELLPPVREYLQARRYLRA